MSSACRLLCIKLTDGKASCKALEMRPLQGAEGDAVAPGAKVLLAGASVKANIVLVDSRSLKVLLLPPHAQDYYLVLGYKFAAMAQSGARVKSHSLAFKNLTMSEGTQASRFVLVLDRQCCLNDNISGACLGRSLHCHLFRSGISLVPWPAAAGRPSGGALQCLELPEEVWGQHPHRRRAC